MKKKQSSILSFLTPASASSASSKAERPSVKKAPATGQSSHTAAREAIDLVGCSPVWSRSRHLRRRTDKEPHNRGPVWIALFQDWFEIRRVCVDFSQMGLTVRFLYLDVKEKMFEERPKFNVVDGDANVRQVILQTYHGQHAFSNRSRPRGALWDLIYNAACEFACVPVVNPAYFTWGAATSRPAPRRGSRPESAASQTLS
ncbi:hypothetical protein HRG_012483 [Hirsutella rhossiliensis]